jgi:hypothetical protein
MNEGKSLDYGEASRRMGEGGEEMRGEDFCGRV